MPKILSPTDVIMFRQRLCDLALKAFAERGLALKAAGIGGIIVAGQSYGQGSSREHAALCPMYLGVRVVLAKSIERIHRANLINFCIVPLTFSDAADYDRLAQDEAIEIKGLREAVRDQNELVLTRADGSTFVAQLTLSQRDRDILLADGLLSFTRQLSQ